MTKSKPKKKTINIIRKEIILSVLPILEKQGFVRSPYLYSEFGFHAGLGYEYDLVRLRGTELDQINIRISFGHGWFSILFNIIELNPTPDTVEDLKGKVGGRDYMFPDKNGCENLAYQIFYPSHCCWLFWLPTPLYRLKYRFTKWGKQRQIRKVTNLLAKDFGRIDEAVEIWHKRHKPIVVDWDGNKLDQP
ncbi:MAG: hypothetical protein NC453_24530 [Muribaculum sp.]|nr:hypothetical protein [Muribaculum sp.]